MYEAQEMAAGIEIWKVVEKRTAWNVNRDILACLEEWQAKAIAAILNSGPSWNGGSDAG